MDSQVYERMMCRNPAVDREYLRGVLRLPAGQTIDQVAVDQVAESNTALTIRFTVCIKDGVRPCQARHLFMKTGKSDSETSAYHAVSLREAVFYRLVRSASTPQLPIVQCLDVYVSEDEAKYLILLADVADTYMESRGADLLDRRVWLSAAESLARLHAAFWNLEKMPPAALPFENEETIRSYASDACRNFERFRHYVGNRLDEATWATLDHALDVDLALLHDSYQRKMCKTNVTLVHGDSHIHNFMMPAAPGGFPILVDFQFWGAGIGAGDLAHLTRVAFPEEFSRTLHEPLARQYYGVLLERGVQGYSWETCLDDYRKHVADMLLIPVWQYAAFGLTYEHWADSIPRLLLNYRCVAEAAAAPSR